MLIEEAVEAMKDPGGNDLYYSLEAASVVLGNPQYMKSLTVGERMNTMEEAVGMLCSAAVHAHRSR